MHEIVYRNILKYMYGGVLVIDLEGSVVTMNAAAERILELSQDDIRARPFAELFLDGIPLNDPTIVECVVTS